MIDLDRISVNIATIEGDGSVEVSVTCELLRGIITLLRQAEKDAARYREIAMDAHGILVASGDNEAADAVYEAVIDVRNN